jgi:hypothetical protein
MSNVEDPCYGPHPQTLGEFIEHLVQRSRDRGYIPHEFLDGLDQQGLIKEIARRVEGSEFKSGFLKVLWPERLLRELLAVSSRRAEPHSSTLGTGRSAAGRRRDPKPIRPRRPPNRPSKPKV